MKIIPFAGFALLAVSTLHADAVISFEQFTDGESLSNQIAGLQFSNATVATAGISLNELEFPPHSGVNVVFDDGGPIRIIFAVPVFTFSGYFTYSTQISLSAFAKNHDLVASDTSKFSSNLALSGVAGSSPDEFLQVASLIGITKITIAGDPAGASYVMDDISLGSSAPEPSSAFLLICGLIGLPLARSKRRRHRA